MKIRTHKEVKELISLLWQIRHHVYNIHLYSFSWGHRKKVVPILAAVRLRPCDQVLDCEIFVKGLNAAPKSGIKILH